MKKAEHRLEVADIFNRYGETYRQCHTLPFSHFKVMRNIQDCRTSVLGGHLDQCSNCAYERPLYNSCCDRHCPKCQTMAKEKWIDKKKEDLLPVPYFHSVFTLPHELNPLILSNKRVILNILFQAVSETLKKFGQEAKLPGQMGFLAILHTWSQNVLDHFHLHCIVPGGVLTKKGDFVVKDSFLFAVQALSLVFRSKFLDQLEKAYSKGELIFPGQTDMYRNPSIFNALVQSLLQKKWVVYSKKPFAGPEQVLEYLGRYTHKVAITNNRIISMDDGMITFSFRDRQDQGKKKTMTLPATEFIRRFLLHVLPARFMKIRAYGFLANRAKKETLSLCRKALKVEAKDKEATKRSCSEIMKELTGKDIALCPKCQVGTMQSVKIIPKDKERLQFGGKRNGSLNSS